MASIDYADVYSRFYLRVKDYEMVGLDEQMVDEMLKGYLKSTLSKPMVRRLFSSIDVDDDLGEIEFELRNPLDASSDRDFVEEVLALGCVEQWASPRYHSTLLTSQLLSNSEQTFYSQSSHLSEMKQLYEKTQTDLRKFIRDYGYNYSVINGVEA